MRKNFFRDALATSMMLVSMGFGFISCAEEDNPLPPVTDPTPGASASDYTLTDEGASFTISSLADATNYLEQIKGSIKKSGDKEFVIDITLSGDLATSATDNTIVLPNISYYNVTLNFKGKLTTAEAPLTLKQDIKPTAVYKNEVALNFQNDDVDLVLDVPGTTVTVDKLNSIQILNGRSIVKTDGEIKTYVFAPAASQRELQNGLAWVPVVDTDGDRYVKPSVQMEGTEEGVEGEAYRFKDVKIVKGEADSVRVWAWNELDKLTIAEGVTVVLNYQPYIKEIAGEGKGAIVEVDDASYGAEPEYKHLYAWANFNQVKKISNVTVKPFLNPEWRIFEGVDMKDCAFDEANIYDLPADLENCTFKYSYYNFQNPESASVAVKNCKFEGVGNNKDIRIIVPAQTESINSFKFAFETCEFAKGSRFNTEFTYSTPKLDADGNKIYRNVYYWHAFDEDGYSMYWNGSSNIEDVPESVKEVGECDGGWDYTEGKHNEYGYSTGYWIQKEAVYETVEYKDYYAYIAFKDCKYDGKALTAETEGLVGGYSIPDWENCKLRYEIDGKLYDTIWDYNEETGMWVSKFVPTDK